MRHSLAPRFVPDSKVLWFFEPTALRRRASTVKHLEPEPVAADSVSAADRSTAQVTLGDFRLAFAVGFVVLFPFAPVHFAPLKAIF
jgi:hypothetical protein